MNKVMLIGAVTSDPDVRYYDVDQAMARLKLSTTESGYTQRDGTKVAPRNDVHNLVFYRQLAKIVEKYVHEGDKLYVEGRLRYNAFEDKVGKRHFVTEIMVENMELLTPVKQ